MSTESLALIDDLVQHVRGGAAEGDAHGGAPLDGARLLMMQHQMGQHLVMVRALLDLGLDPRKTTSVDTPYTSQDCVQAALRDELGIADVRRHGFTWETVAGAAGQRGSYHDYQRGRVARALVDVADAAVAEQRNGRPCHVAALDDGGYVPDALATLPPDSVARDPSRVRWSVVEQTQRGIIRFNEAPELRSLPVRVVNVAESRTKKGIESSHIGASVVENLFDLLAHEPRAVRDAALDNASAALVVGYGAIGAAVARALRNSGGASRRRIYVVDPSPAAQRAARTDGFEAVGADDVPDKAVSLVVGCSGSRSFGLESAASLVASPDGAVLASASSGNHEFGVEELVSAAQMPGSDVECWTPELLRSTEIHATLGFDVRARDGERRRLHVLNGGFPVTFIGRLHAVPPGKIAPTLGLMTAGALQAAAHCRESQWPSRMSVEPLSADVDAWLTDAARRHDAL